MAKREQRGRGAGSLQWRSGHLWVRVSLPDGTRPWYRLCAEECTCHEMSDARAEESAASIAEVERARVKLELADRQRRLLGKRQRVRDFGHAYTNGDLFKEFGRKVYGNKAHLDEAGRKASHEEDAWRLKWAFDVVIGSKRFGDFYLDEVTEEHAQRVLANPPKHWRPATNLQAYQVLHRLFEVAAFPCRLRPRTREVPNPFGRELRPFVPRGDLMFQWLYPDELLALLRHPSIPVARRVLYALAVYTGQRKASLRSLRWGNVDFAHGALTSPNQKNGIPLTFEVGEDLLGILRAWQEVSGSPKSTAAIVSRMGCRWARVAEQLRADLVAAGVTRAALQGLEQHEQALRFHDLRATCVVWGLKDKDKGYGWVTDRTGHLSDSMLRRYDRVARNWREAAIVPFPSLTGALPELAAGRTVVGLTERRTAG